MSKQPLTPQNSEIIVVSHSIHMITDALRVYGIPTDAGNIEPVITIHKITSLAEFNILMLTPPDDLVPWAFAGDPTFTPYKLIAAVTLRYGNPTTLARALAMKNNETVLRPKL